MNQLNPNQKASRIALFKETEDAISGSSTENRLGLDANSVAVEGDIESQQMSPGIIMNSTQLYVGNYQLSLFPHSVYIFFALRESFSGQNYLSLIVKPSFLWRRKHSRNVSQN